MTAATPLASIPADSVLLTLRGVRTQNLKGIDVDIPANSLVAITGVSGAGKTSLAIETLAAEGQRRFMETFPASARRFLDRLERPDADEIGPLPPPIILRRGHGRPSRRATVSTLSELHPSLQQLFADAGETICPDCEQPVEAHSASTIASEIAVLPVNQRFQICFSRKLQPAEVADVVASELMEAGFQRVIVAGQTLALKVPLPSDWPQEPDWTVVVDRLQTGKLSADRVRDSLELALQRGAGACFLIIHGESEQTGQPFVVDGATCQRRWFFTQLICANCHREFPVPTPRLFSFHSPQGACPRCQGTGEVENGVCPDCHGYRLNPLSLAVRFGTHCVDGGYHLGQILEFTVAEVHHKLLVPWLLDSHTRIERAGPAIGQLQERLTLLERLGLGYLQLNRSGRSLSTGEVQRLALAATLSVRLVESLYVLDEPAAGLHPQEIEQLITILRELQARRNSVVVVDHSASLIRSVDAVIDLGPGAGPEGGQLIHQGTPQTLLECVQSATAAYLSGRTTVQRRTTRQPTSWLSLRGIRNRTLQDRDIEFPLGTLCAVTGISGSGKSTLLRDTLYPALSETLGHPIAGEAAGTIRQLSGVEALQVVTYVDQSPPEKSGRSNVATASGMWAEMRSILAATSEAKIRQFTAGTFSFHNARGGRCTTCEGLGTLAIDLQFLADLQVTCPDCHGTRFQREVLEVKYRGLSVAEILKLTVSQALPFFRGKSRLQRRLKALKDVGLSYLQLGQPIYSLSGGETQRLQLATQMTGRAIGATLYLLDEPARGLHPAEIQGLVNWFDDLLNEGHSLIVIEHRPELIAVCDHVVEMR